MESPRVGDQLISIAIGSAAYLIYSLGGFTLANFSYLKQVIIFDICIDKNSGIK